SRAASLSRQWREQNRQYDDTDSRTCNPGKPQRDNCRQLAVSFVTQQYVDGCTANHNLRQHSRPDRNTTISVARSEHGKYSELHDARPLGLAHHDGKPVPVAGRSDAMDTILPRSRPGSQKQEEPASLTVSTILLQVW